MKDWAKSDCRFRILVKNYMILTTEGLGYPRPRQASAACSDWLTQCVELKKKSRRRRLLWQSRRRRLLSAQWHRGLCGGGEGDYGGGEGGGGGGT